MSYINDPAVISREYATETGLAGRAGAYAEATGPHPYELIVELVDRSAPVALLDVGCGLGVLAQTLAARANVTVRAVDSSERMVQLARERGVEAQLADVQELPFGDASFGVVTATWMLYHLPDLDRGLSEIGRVLAPGGRLLAVTNSERHLEELWALVGIPRGSREFTAENGQEVLRRHFPEVTTHELEGSVRFADADAVRAYLASTIRGKQFVDAVPPLNGPFVATRRNAVFVATV